MEVENRKFGIEKKDNEIIYSKAIKAGKRIYYLDVKKSRNDDLYLAITESKKKVTGYDEDAQVTYEKHKIFLYKEDFEKFVEGLNDVIGFIKNAGQNCKCVGCWKVYCNECEAIKAFARFKKCTSVYVRLWNQGRSVRQLTVAA